MVEIWRHWILVGDDGERLEVEKKNLYVIMYKLRRMKNLYENPQKTFSNFEIVVVYFDQRLGTAHSKRWSK